MKFSAALVASVLPLGLAFTWCSENEDTVCLENGLPKSCYDCLHPIETSCTSGDEIDHKCACPIPGDTFTGISKCINDPSTGCAADAKAILGAWSVDCGTAWDFPHQQAVCNSEAKQDPVKAVLADSICDGDVPPPKSTGAASAPTSSAASNPSKTSAAAGATETKPSGAATTTAAGHTSAAGATHITTVVVSQSGTTIAVPTTVVSHPPKDGAAVNMKLSGSVVAGFAAVAAAMIGM